MVNVTVNGVQASALLDTGCGKSIIARQSGKLEDNGPLVSIVTINNQKVSCRGVVNVLVECCGMSARIECLVLDKLVDGADIVLGMDAIDVFGGIRITTTGIFVGTCLVGQRQKRMPGVAIPRGAACGAVPATVIEDTDFVASFDGKEWTALWKWKKGPAVLKSTIASYGSVKDAAKKSKFDEEVQVWIDKGWLKPWKSDRGGRLPLMAVEQPNKNKVRPVLDYRELNTFIESNPGLDAPACDETIRRWRRMKGPLKLVDLRSAYLQIRIDPSLWDFQQVCFKNRSFCLTRLGFGLSSAPKIMSRIVEYVLSQNAKIKQGTGSYIDDILVDESVVSAEEVVAHLKRFGLEAKPPVKLHGERVLGLEIREEAEQISFRRGNDMPVIPPRELSRREFFSVCGRLVGHYPVANWLRVACSYSKRHCQGERWDDAVGAKAMTILREIIERVQHDDPVKGRWTVPTDTLEGVVWCDASSVAYGVALEIDGAVVEDAAWLRKETDVGHINIAELDAVMRGINLALKWGLKQLKVMCDSATVVSWLRSACDLGPRAKVSGASEMLIRRRLGTIRELIAEFQLELIVVFVPSEKNKADALTRVKKSWLAKPTGLELQLACVADVRKLHEQHHFGVDRSLYLARLVDPTVSREEMSQCIRECTQCRSIDPAPTVHEPGELEVQVTIVQDQLTFVTAVGIGIHALMCLMAPEHPFHRNVNQGLITMLFGFLVEPAKFTFILAFFVWGVMHYVKPNTYRSSNKGDALDVGMKWKRVLNSLTQKQFEAYRSRSVDETPRGDYVSRGGLKMREIMEVHGWEPNGKVVDLGCGRGGWSQHLAMVLEGIF